MGFVVVVVVVWFGLKYVEYLIYGEVVMMVFYGVWLYGVFLIGVLVVVMGWVKCVWDWIVVFFI